MYHSQRENRRKRWYTPFIFDQRGLRVLAAVLSVGLLSVVGVLAYYTCRALEFDIQRVVAGSGDSLLYDANNGLIGPLAPSGNSFAAWDDLPPKLVDAFLAREDENFFEHSGIVYSSVLRALVRNIQAGHSKEGASTITMQLTRNVFELSDKTLDRKMLEAALAQRVEKNYDKYTIFTQYVNRIYYGENCYGIVRAAAHYFGKPVRELNLVECATLAGLVRGPSIFNPCVDMKKAMVVKEETLNRMLELESITPEQHAEALEAPIVLAPHDEEETLGGSYALLRANVELEQLRKSFARAEDDPLRENAGGIAVVSHLLLPLQQYAEAAMERALQAVETPDTFPSEWEKQLGGRPVLSPELRRADAAAWQKGREQLEALEGHIKRFATARRPEGFKVRKQDNDLSGLLQCCVLVVDTRKGRCGNVLAVIGGRSVADGMDRWQGTLRPGRAAAPLVFCCTCLPGKEMHHIVDYSAQVTGERLGYDVVHSFINGLKLGVTLPPREQESALYNGLYDMKRQQLARVLFSLVNGGRDYSLSTISSIWSRNRVALYSSPESLPPELIIRQGARTVSRLAPFLSAEGRTTVLNEWLPDGTGQFSMVNSRDGVCCFVWMGFDEPTNPVASSREMRRLLGRAALYLAREIHNHVVEQRRAEREAAKQAEKEKLSKEAQTDQ